MNVKQEKIVMRRRSDEEMSKKRQSERKKKMSVEKWEVRGEWRGRAIFFLIELRKDVWKSVLYHEKSMIIQFFSQFN